MNARVDVATTFLCWAADKGLRQTFDVRTTTRNRLFTTGGRRGAASVTARADRLLEQRSSTFERVEDLPAEGEIRDWLLGVRAQRVDSD